ncbi:ABC transporter ATP-binding protein [Halobacillus salinarum]|uniref:ABC transporter ATP-binding protein n=1 Tax=Halobacillus salinarum TaxID=2932257 RepID=A0ABY4EK46_9BACI|nr:ABC transporter ATP-binding protein [Halobacillus salinarum]UOQ44842.1 ABC transporter ATP-binding protein [Halobacillus salinarum]
MIKVQHLTKVFGTEKVVSDLSFLLEEGTSTALIGPNGAGKTTTLSMLTGLLKPTNGSVSMQNVQDIRKEIGFLPQYPNFYPWLTALEFTEMTAKLNGVPNRDAKKQAEKMLEFVGLKNDLFKKTAVFSGGMKQRLGIAQAIVHKPRLLVLDEPVSALDPVGRREMINLLKQLQQQSTILYSTHILNDAEEMTDQLLFLNKGKLVEQGSLKDIRAKFDSSRFKVQFSSTDDALLFASQVQLPTLADKNCVFIEIIDNIPTMQQLMSQLIELPFTILKVERVTLTLEEIFMKVVGQ